jgi:peptidoglycan/LPS O-acetylase OafA/YrhL
VAAVVDSGSSSRRIYELDLLRISAALMVLLYHYTFRGAAQGGFSPIVYPHALGEVSRYGVFGVELFFFISGLVIMRTASSGSPRRFAISRIVRLYPAYWIMVTVSFVILRLWGAPSLYGPFGIKHWLLNMTMLQTFFGAHLVDGVYWTLAKELVFYGIVWLVLITGQLRRMLIVLAAWALLSGLLEVVHPVLFARTWLATDYASFFVVGACCALLGDQRREGALTTRRTGPVVGVMVVGLGFALFQVAHHVRQINQLPLVADRLSARVAVAVVFGCFLLVLAVALGFLHGLGRPWMVAAGALTYPLYLVHQNVGYVLLTRGRSFSNWVVLVVVTAGLAGLAWLVHRLVEVPVGPRLKKVLGSLADRALGGAIVG